MVDRKKATKKKAAKKKAPGEASKSANSPSAKKTKRGRSPRRIPSAGNESSVVNVALKKGAHDEDGIERDENWLPWYDIFLESLRTEFSVVNAAGVAGKTARTCYRHREAHKGFAEAWSQAWNTITDKLEASAMRRAINGVKEPVFYRDQIVGVRNTHETSLTIFMLKKNMKDKYDDDASGDERDAREVARQFRAAMAEMDSSIPTEFDEESES